MSPWLVLRPVAEFDEAFEDWGTRIFNAEGWEWSWSLAFKKSLIGLQSLQSFTNRSLMMCDGELPSVFRIKYSIRLKSDKFCGVGSLSLERGIRNSW